MYPFRNKASCYDEELLAPHPTQISVRPPLIVCLRLLIHYIRSYPQIGGRSPIRNLMTHHAAVTGTQLSWQ